MSARAGITLLETMIASVIATIVLTATFRGVVASTRVCHENSQVLAAEAFAWETAWIWLNKRYEGLDAKTYSMETISSEECPVLSREQLGAPAQYVVRVTEYIDSTALTRHGTSIPMKMIEVNVIWGLSNNRRALNTLSAANVRSCGIPMTLYKSSIERNIQY